MASALIQMSSFSPCSQLANMIMMGAEGSLESFPGSREEANKRSNFDNDEEQDRIHVKKRRKQSKPIRITASESVTNNKNSALESGHYMDNLEFSETGEHFMTENIVDIDVWSLQPKEVTRYVQSRIQETNEISKDNHDKSEETNNVYKSIFPLNLSSTKLALTDSPVVPSTSDSQNSPSKPVSVDTPQCTTHDSSKIQIAQESTFISQSPSLLLPLLKHSQIQGQTQMSQFSPQMRIFNPEAFCDLCNKEFCNKYFLKTHKANKHGIYTDNPVGQTLLDQMPSLPFTNYFSTNNESFESLSPFQGTNISKSLFNQTNVSLNQSITKKKLAPQPQQNNLLSLKTNSSGNMRALCNICQREFCNKYFVRRHKLKIHGIIDSAPKENSVIDLQDNSSNINSQDKHDLISEGESYSEYLKQFLPLNFNLDIKAVSQNVEISVDKLKEKSNQDCENEPNITLASHNIPASDSSGFKVASLSEDNNKENNIFSNKLKKYGVVNADAFCEICCKEYCNKYFLRTHKLKSHGILPVEDKKDDLVNGAAMLWYQNQSTPLNLIVNSPNNRDISDNTIVEIDGEEFVCNTCGQNFQNPFLLKMHQAYHHPNKHDYNNEVPAVPRDKMNSLETHDSSKPQSTNCSPVVKSDYTKESEENESKATLNRKSFKKLQNLISRLSSSNAGESSLCDVCEKDVGHVYLLENHILKEHALMLEEMGNLTEEGNSNSQSYLTPHSFSIKKECPLCQCGFGNLSLLEQHINNVHGDSESLVGPDKCRETNDGSPNTTPVQFPAQSPEEKPGLQPPASSFCEICKKELCNKYFMKTHMQRMHGISIENGSQIGGVVCDICNKELCSKYFLRVHKQNSHGIVDELFLPQIGLDVTRNHSPNGDPALKPTDPTDQSNRYFSHFNEVCTICNRRFRSVKWLKAHLLNDHGDEGNERWKDIFLPCGSESKSHDQLDNNLRDTVKHLNLSSLANSSNQPNTILNEKVLNGKDLSDKGITVDKTMLNSTMFSMLMNGKDSEVKHYQCSYCSFSTSILAFLFIHERSHLNTKGFQMESDRPFQCPLCSQNMETKQQFEDHQKLHKVSWQQMYSSVGLNRDLPPVVRKTPDERSELAVSKDKDIHRDQESEEVLRSHQESKPSIQYGQFNESSIQCSRCGFNTNNMQVYIRHVNVEHPFLQMDHELPSYLQQMEKILSLLAYNSGIPAVFAAPRVQDQVTMQPFVLEDSEFISNINNSNIPNSGKTFLSSLVFLPVKEKLKKSVTASFKLTPT